MTAGSAAGTSAPATGTPAIGPAGTGPAGTGAWGSGPGAGRHTGGRSRRTARPAPLSLSNWPVRTRLAAVFIAASVTGLVFGGLRVSDAVNAANGYARTTQLAVMGKQITLLAQDLENERDLTVGVEAVTALQQNAVTAKAGPAVTASLQQALTTEQGLLAHAQGATGIAVAPVQQLVQAVVTDSAFPVSIQDSANSVVAQVSNGDLGTIRIEVLGQSPAVIIDDYSDTIGDLFALNDQLASSSGDALLSNEVSALGALSRAKDQAAQQRAILYAAYIESGLNDAGGAKATKTTPASAPFNNLSGPAALNFGGGLQALVTAQDLQDVDLRSFQLAATPAESEAFLAAVVGPQVQTAQNIYTIVTSANGDPRAIFPQVTELSARFTPATAPALWYADQSAVVGAMRTVENQLATQIVAHSQLLQHQAFESAVITSVATVLVILLVLAATALIGRTLVNPLRRLQADALEIAAVRLPARVAAAGTDSAEGTAPIEPIGVRSTDEIGRVARAFDQVHAEAVRLAGNEAQLRSSLNSMFISLSRRSVPLIERLARMIDAMEQNEDDPEQLGKLFSMDHMVTRMRRNSENLLVLAGEEPVRKWTDSVPLSDVTRAAAAEIEQYSRVALAVQPGIMVSGQAAADVVHLLAELIENATMFSPQSTQVRVTVMELSSGGVLVEVRDDGVGVSANRLTDMNWRLDHPPVVDVSISRHMGLYAVARLAARHGIRVRLRPGTPQGLSALAWLPGTLAKREPTPAPGSRSRAFGVDATGPLAGIRPPMPARNVAGRHRNALDPSGERSLAAGRGGQGGQGARSAAAVWFTAKRPSSAAPMPAAQLASGWQPATADWQPATGGGPGRPEHTGQTTSGLPRRVPRTSQYPGSDTPGSGLLAGASAGAPPLGGPLDGTPPQGVPYQEHTQDVPYQEHAQGVPYQEHPHQERVPSGRRTPEAARSRLSGFQLGSRDAVQAGHTTGRTPHAEEENGR
jgi:signal transduction histidine kinase